MFRIPAVRLAEAQLRHNANVYMYCFAWRSTGFDGAMGAFHFLEVPFVFDTIDDPMSINFTGPKAPQALADAVHGSWVRFVADGQPTHPNLPAWPAYDVNRRATMYLDEQSKVVDDPASTERQLWDGVL
jgi:para-nitrobenzyl esterase